MLEVLFNKYAPFKEKVVAGYPAQQQWITEDSLVAERDRHKSENRKTGLESDRDKYRRDCEKVNDLIHTEKAQ